jgi:hypothetical protein
VERHARAAVAHSLVAEEAARAGEVERQVARAGKAYYRCVGGRRAGARRARRLTLLPPIPASCRAPMKPTECQAEEAAVLACAPGAACTAAARAYEACAERALGKLIHPLK